MQYECGCYYGPEEQLEPCCPLHHMPIKINNVTDEDIEWAVNELRRFGHLSEYPD